MGRKRMFSNSIISSARFIKMPSSTQALYFHLGCKADDDGVVEAFSVMQMCGFNEDDLKLLHAKGFVVILNDDFVTYIIDWLEHNTLRPDRKKDSLHQELLLSIVPGVELLEKKQRSDRKQKSNNEEIERFPGPSHDSPGSDTGRPSIDQSNLNQFNLVEYSNNIDTYKETAKENVVETFELPQERELKKSLQSSIPPEMFSVLEVFCKTHKEIYDTFGIMLRAKKEVIEQREKYGEYYLCRFEDYDSSFAQLLRRCFQQFKTNSEINNKNNYLFKSCAGLVEELILAEQLQKNDKNGFRFWEGD